MILAYTLTVPATDTGYNLWERLVAAGIPLSALPITRRVASLRLMIDGAETDTLYLVPKTGALTTTTGTVPDQYGYALNNTANIKTFSDERNNLAGNAISLEEICVASDAAATVFHLWAYTI